MSQQTLLTCQQVADELVSYVRTQEFEKAINTLYAQDILSTEAMSYGDSPKEQKGINNILQKSLAWVKANTVNRIEVSEPLVTEHEFAVKMLCDITNKQTGQQMVMTELCVYTVENGKITQEQFFYDTRFPS